MEAAAARDLLAPERIQSFMLLMAHIAPIVALTPFFGGYATPASVRAALTVALSLLVWDLSPPVETLRPLSEFIGRLLAGALYGALIGWTASLVCHAVAAALHALDVARGSPNLQVFLPEAGQRSSPLGRLGFMMTLFAYVELGAPRRLLAALLTADLTERSIPDHYAPLAAAAMFEAGRVLSTAMTLAVPGIACSLLVDVTFGLWNRIALTLQTYFLSLSAKSVVAVAALAAALVPFAVAVHQHVAEHLIWMEGAVP